MGNEAELLDTGDSNSPLGDSVSLLSGKQEASSLEQCPPTFPGKLDYPFPGKLDYFFPGELTPQSPFPGKLDYFFPVELTPQSPFPGKLDYPFPGKLDYFFPGKATFIRETPRTTRRK